MTTTVISIIGLFLALFLLIYLAFKGHSVIIIAPIVAIVAVVFSSGGDSHVMANYTETYMAGFANYAKSYFPLYLFGAVFAKIMEVSGYADAISHAIAKKLGKNKAILSVVLCCAILTYGGVSLFVVTFVVLPIAISLFREADIPKRLIPGSIALGAFTFTMTALPGSPQVQNTIPMTYFGTDAFAAPVLGIIASIIMFGAGMFWLTRREKSARLKGEGYGDHQDETNQMEEKDLPSIIHPIIAFALIVGVNLFFSKVYYPGVDGSYLEAFGTKLSAVSGNWSVLIALLVAILYLVIVSFARLRHSLKGDLKTAAANSLMPLINSCAVVGFGSVIKGLAIFTIIQTFILSISANPLVSEILAVNLLCGMTASASGGLGATLEALAPTFIDAGAKIGIGPEVLHRVASISSGGLDSLPHNGATVTTLSLCKISHHEGYLDMFVCSVAIPIATAIIIALLASIGIRC
jgi:H+/gluconate symporter-like permease